MDEHNWGRQDFRFAKRMGKRAFAFARGVGGPKGMFGEGFPSGRFVGDGELRLLVLALLAENPRHGYDIIKALEERSNGFYSPSPGVVYPTLTFLEEVGQAVSSSDGNKKTYSVTEAGRAHLEANREAVDAVFSRIEWVGRRMAQAREWFDWGRSRWGSEDDGERDEPRNREPSRPDRDIPDALPEVNNARRELKGAIAEKLGSGREAQLRMAEILERAAAEIRRIEDRGTEPEIDLG